MTGSRRVSASADLVIVGGGMAGLTAGARAASDGARVVLLEKSPSLGGSAALSSGMVWTSRSMDEFLIENPDGDIHLGRVLVSDYVPAVQWIASTGTWVSDEEVPVLSGRGRQIDIGNYLERCGALIEGSGGHVLKNVDVQQVLTDADGIANGVRAVDHGGVFDVLSPWTLLATGGFQGSRPLLRRFLGNNSDRLVLRSNVYSTGDGLRLAMASGADISDDMKGFYGHLVASPLREWKPQDYLRLALVFSDKAVLVNEAGLRFCDESRGDHYNAQELSREEGLRGLLIFDRSLQEQVSGASVVKGLPTVDPVVECRDAGANVLVEESIDALSEAITSLGFPGSRVKATVEEFNDAIAAGRHPVDAPRNGHRFQVGEGPFFAVETKPAITFTHGGIRIDSGSRVLSPDGSPVLGLLAAGADAGGTFNGGYAGGLCMSTVFGLRAAETVAES